MVQDSSIPATLTALHVALAMFRRHRAGSSSVFSPFVAPSFVLTIAPWIASSPAVLIGGVVTHILWIIACEVLAPKSRPKTVRLESSTPRASTRHDGDAAPPLNARPNPFVQTPVLATFEETPEIRLFRLRRPEGFHFTAGQFIPVRVLLDGTPHIRCYSICSAPETPGYLEIAVRRQGRVSEILHASLRAGSEVSIGRPAGSFVYPEGDQRPLAFLAGGVGITPLLAMLRYGIAAEPGRALSFLYSARGESDVAFANELRLIAARHPQVRIGVTLSRPAEESVWRRGRIDADMIRTFVPDPARTLFYLCGPAAMIEDLSSLLHALGVPQAHVRFERFDTAIAATSLLPPPRDVESSTHAGSRGYRVRFAVSGREAFASNGHSLLEIAEGAGITISSSCRSGVCQTCRTRLVSGQADCRSDLLDPSDRGAGFILPCVTWASSDCVLET